MILIENFLKELEQEAQTTRKMLSRIPDDQFSWKPHLKSMDIKALATHIAELPTWVGMALKTEGLDFATSPYSPVDVNTTAGLLDYLESSLADARKNLESANDEDLKPEWTLRTGDDPCARQREPQPPARSQAVRLPRAYQGTRLILQ